MMLWIRWVEIYCVMVSEFMCGELERAPIGRPSPLRGPAAIGSDQPDRNVIDMSAERAKRRRQAMRAL